MNKLVKGSLAIGAGAVLLIGGAGTFAFWNDDAVVAGGNITAGNLLVESAAAATDGWSVQKDGTGTAVEIDDISLWTASPGDLFTYRTTVAVTATGDNLEATLSLGASSVLPAVVGDVNDEALATYLEDSAVITAVGDGVAAGTEPGSYLITAGEDGVVDQLVEVAVEIDFPKSATAGAENATQNGAVSLQNLTVSLNQI